MLSADEFKRYERQLTIPGIGIAGQEKLRSSRVLVAGVGGLGCNLLVQLASAGVGTLRFADDGDVELTNLNRQFLFSQEDIGSNKAEAAAAQLAKINPHVKLEPLARMITDKSAMEMAKGCDLIIDALDNILARLCLNKASLKMKIPLVHASVEGMEARVAVFNPRAKNAPCLRCLYPKITHCTKVPVLGSAPALAASIEAMEAIKYLAGTGFSLEGRLLIYDGKSGKFDSAKLAKNPQCPDCG